MRKKYVLLRLLITLVVAIVTFLGINRVYKTASTTTQTQEEGRDKQLNLKFSDLQANYPPNPDACLAAGSDPNMMVDATDQTNIDFAATNTIIDIPAGTKVDVNIKTYDKTVATGTSIYESTYGSYNFVAKKVKTSSSSDQESWVVTELVACKK